MSMTMKFIHAGFAQYLEDAVNDTMRLQKVVALLATTLMRVILQAGGLVADYNS